MITSNTPLKDLRRVKVHFVPDGGPYNTHEHIIHKDYVPQFVEATVKLHYSPGVNPATREETARLYYIECYELVPEQMYWWGCPDLEGSDGAPKAQVKERGCGPRHEDWRIWVSPEWQAESDRCYEQD